LTIVWKQFWLGPGVYTDFSTSHAQSSGSGLTFQKLRFVSQLVGIEIYYWSDKHFLFIVLISSLFWIKLCPIKKWKCSGKKSRPSIVFRLVASYLCNLCWSIKTPLNTKIDHRNELTVCMHAWARWLWNA